MHVAAGVIVNPRGEVLLSRRAPQADQGGLWEFPGGKVEAGETAEAALARELHEELGIEVRCARPLIRIPHSYPSRDVLLDVWRVDAYLGDPHGREGQPLAWVPPDELSRYRYPAANLPIVTAARLPAVYLITGEPAQESAVFLARLERCLQKGVRLVQLRAKALDEQRYSDLARESLALCRRYGAQLLLNAEPRLVTQLGADGVHLSSARLRALAQRPLGADCWVAASCHDAAELELARRLGVDFAVASPVKATASHPGMPTLGFDGLRRLTERATIPIFALGGMCLEDCAEAWCSGAQGIAAIGALWEE